MKGDNVVNMTVTQFKYVIEVSKAGSINRAANNLFVSQSALSTAIKNLEKELDRQIFSRTNKGVELTPFGREFVHCITPINMQLDQLYKMVSNPSTSYSMSLSIASASYFFISSIVADIYNKYRSVGIKIESYEGSINEIINFVHSQIVEVGIIRRWSCYRNANEKQLNSLKLRLYPIASLKIGVTVGPNSPLFHLESNYVSREMLGEYPAVMYHYLNDGPYSDIYERLQIPASSNRIVSLSRAMIYEILGRTDAYYLDSLYSKDPSEIRTKGVPYPQRTLLLSDCEIKSEIGWLVEENHILSPIASKFIEMLTEYINDSI